jgi:hypothetical protein
MSFYDACVRSWRDLQIRGILPIHEAFPFSPAFTENKMTMLDYLTAAKKAIVTFSIKYFWWSRIIIK